MRILFDSPPQIISKTLHYALSTVLLAVLFASFAHGGSIGKDLLDPKERLWLTENQSRIILAVETSYPPFVFIDSKDRPSGLAQDYIVLLESKLGTHFKQRRFSSLDDIFEKARGGEVHIVNAVTKTPFRSTFLNFTEPFITVPNAIIVRNERQGTMHEKDLSGLKVSMVRSYAVTEHLAQKDLGFLLDPVPDDLTALLNVSFGRSDAAVTDIATASYLISQKGITNLRVAGEAAFDIQLAIGVPINEPVLHAIIQKGLAAISDEERQVISKRWISVSRPSLLSDRRFWGVTGSVLSAVVAVIFGMLIWNRTLRQQVALRTLALNTEKEALRESKEQFKAMFEMASIGMAQADPRNGQWQRVNQKMCEITGYSSSELLGMRAPEITHPEDRERDWEAFQNVVEGKSQSYRMEKRYIRKDGTLVWVNVNMTVIRDSAGNPMRTMTTIEDISERKGFEEALQKSEENYRSLFENAPVGIFQTNARGQALSVNFTMAHILGLGSPREAVEHYSNLGGQLYLHPEKRDQFLRLLKQDGYVENFEYEALTADGSKIWLSMNARIKGRCEDGSFIIEGFATDITQRKHAESERTLLATAVEQAEENVLITDAHRTILYINPAFERSSGYRLEKLKGKKLRVLRSDQHDNAFYQNMKEVLDRGEVWVGDIINRGEDGREFEIEGTISPIKDASGTITHLVAAGRNMIRYRKLERELYQAQKMESVGRLAGGVAHDFNNMLGVILGHTELALDGIDSAQSAYDDLQEVRKAANRSADLVRQLLAFARKQTISPKVLNINETVESMLKMVRRLIGEDIELVWRPGADIWPVKVDPTQIDQVLANLCVNARDAITGLGKVIIETGNVTLDDACCREHTGASPGGYVLLGLSDTGCGMDRETIGKVFEPFFTTKEVGKGTGLGLATVYGIVKQNNGFIDVLSEPGQGTTFRIYLPRTDIPTAENSPLEPQRRNLTGSETVLLVEDEASILAMGKTILERYGYTVLANQSPGEALKMAQNHPGPLHLLITDIVMPEMNGKDLRERLEALKPAIKCIFISGYTADVIAHQGILEEGVHFLQKPFSVKGLVEKVRDVLDV